MKHGLYHVVIDNQDTIAEYTEFGWYVLGSEMEWRGDIIVVARIDLEMQTFTEPEE